MGQDQESQFYVMGPLKVERGGSLVDVGGVKLRILLARLLLAPNLVVPVDRLIEALWGDEATDRSLETLHVYMAKLRKALGDDGSRRVIETVRPGYRARVDDQNLDLLRFQSLVRQAKGHRQAGQLAKAGDSFAKALAEVRGPLLADLANEEFVHLESLIFDASLLATTMDALEIELDRGHHQAATTELHRLSALHPLDERLTRLLMIALYRSGQQAKALEAYGRLRRSLADDLGVDPSPELQDLELQILNHDESLVGTGPSARLVPEGTVTATRTSRPAPIAELHHGADRFLLDRAVTTVGRHSGRTVVIDDPGASRHHAEIKRTPRGFLLVDVGSRNGTLVNDLLVAERLLEDGDVIQIGNTKLAFHIV